MPSGDSRSTDSPDALRSQVRFRHGGSAAGPISAETCRMKKNLRGWVRRSGKLETDSSRRPGAGQARTGHLHSVPTLETTLGAPAGRHRVVGEPGAIHRTNHPTIQWSMMLGKVK